MKHMQQRRRINQAQSRPKWGGSVGARLYSGNRSSGIFMTQSSRFWDSSSQRAIL